MLPPSPSLPLSLPLSLFFVTPIIGRISGLSCHAMPVMIYIARYEDVRMMGTEAYPEYPIEQDIDN